MLRLLRSSPPQRTRSLVQQIATSSYNFMNSDVEMIAANNRLVVVADTCSQSNMTVSIFPHSTHKMNDGNSTISRRKYSNAAYSSDSATSSSSPSKAEMKDEYGTMNANGETFTVSNFALENGVIIPEAQLRYQTYGSLNQKRDNCVMVCHALTGNASLDVWWGDMLGPGRAFDTSKYFVVCCNILGSCYGSTSPASMNPLTPGKVYGKDFPDVSVQDTVRLQLQLLQQEMQVHSVKAVIGGSFGGMQVLEFAVQAGSTTGLSDPDGCPYVRSIVPIACNAQHGAWQIAISEVQRQAIYKDPHWNSDDPVNATTGLEIARQMAMISYRTFGGYASKFGRHQVTSNNSVAYGQNATWQVANYLDYQGRKFLTRFDPVTYVKLTQQMDSHDVARNRGGDVVAVLGRVQIPALVLGIDSDILYPLSEQKQIADLLPNAHFAVVNSNDGHDGFLLEQEQVGRYISDFLAQHE